MKIKQFNTESEHNKYYYGALKARQRRNARIAITLKYTAIVGMTIAWVTLLFIQY